MNIFFKAIQKSFDLLDQKETKKISFMKALEYMLKIAEESEYEAEICTINTDENGDILIIISTKKATLTIVATPRISYTGKGPKEEDKIYVINTDSYSVSEEVFEWIQRNRK